MVDEQRHAELGFPGFSAAHLPNHPNPNGDFANMVDDIFMTTVLWAALMFVLLEGALLAAIFKFRDRSATAELKQGHGSTAIEVVWTIIPALILAILAAPTMRAVFSP